MYVAMKMRKSVGIEILGTTHELSVADMEKGVCGILLVFANRSDAEAAAGDAGVVEIEAAPNAGNEPRSEVGSI
jgi:hypothetical protein